MSDFLGISVAENLDKLSDTRQEYYKCSAVDIWSIHELGLNASLRMDQQAFVY